jgi:hypothetical protein
MYKLCVFAVISLIGPAATLTVGPAQAQNVSWPAALHERKAPTLTERLDAGRLRFSQQISFCGACQPADVGACGIGWLCCHGDCQPGLYKCYQVTTCP